MNRIWKYIQIICTLLVIGASIVTMLTVRTTDATPGIINYQGRVQSNGADFTGPGSFKFALIRL